MSGRRGTRRADWWGVLMASWVGKNTKSIDGAATGAGEEVVVWKPCINGLRVGVIDDGVGRVVVLEERVVD